MSSWQQKGGCTKGSEDFLLATIVVACKPIDVAGRRLLPPLLGCRSWYADCTMDGWRQQNYLSFSSAARRKNAAASPADSPRVMVSPRQLEGR